MDNLQIPLEIPDVKIEKSERSEDGDFVITGPNTTLYERHVLPGLICGTIEDVGMKEDIGYEAVMGIIELPYLFINSDDYQAFCLGSGDEQAVKLPSETALDFFMTVLYNISQADGEGNGYFDC